METRSGASSWQHMVIGVCLGVLLGTPAGSSASATRPAPWLLTFGSQNFADALPPLKGLELEGLDPSNHAVAFGLDRYTAHQQDISAGPPEVSHGPESASGQAVRIQQGYGRLPMRFEANVGQTAAEVRYFARGPGYTLFLTETESVFVLRRGNRHPARNDHQASASLGLPSMLWGALRTQSIVGGFSPVTTGVAAMPPHPTHAALGDGPTPETSRDPPFSPVGLGSHRSSRSHRRTLLEGQRAPVDAAPKQAAVVRMRLEGATRNPSPEVSGLEQQPGTTNYIIGNDPSQWHSGIPSFSRVHYKDVYPGIDLVFYGNPRQLEYDFVVAPGADPSQIQLAFDGVDHLRIDDVGDLVLAVAGGELVQRAPRIFQRVEGQKREVIGRYVFREVGSGRAQASPALAYHAQTSVGFEVAAYAADAPLVIDPVLVYSTYLGGSSGEAAPRIALDSGGNAYVTGTTYSGNFPTKNALYPNLWGTSDAFVFKLNPQGSAPVYSTYLGGSDDEHAGGIAIDSAGNAYVTGTTYSGDFPRKNALYPKLWGTSDAFVFKLNPQGNAPV